MSGKTGTGLELLRHTLHRHAELSGEEEATARLVEAYLLEFDPNEIITELGGHGLAAVFDSGKQGASILVRCELDALPIEESEDLSYHSRSKCVSHKCGHDGHMTMIAGLASRFQEQPLDRGKLILLFQPAEETGAGAASVINDPSFSRIKPDRAISLHNLPGYPLGSVVLLDGVFASASIGIEYHLTGTTSHASEPEKGHSPAKALSRLIDSFDQLSRQLADENSAARLTVIHAKLGEVAFGTSPGTAVIMLTIRDFEDDKLFQLKEKCTEIARQIAGSEELGFDIVERDLFPSTKNDSQLVAIVKSVATECGHQVIEPKLPFRWSEDFGQFGNVAPAMMFGLGSGEDQPPLHHPDYDFPDELLLPGRDLLEAVIRRLSSTLE